MWSLENTNAQNETLSDEELQQFLNFYSPETRLRRAQARLRALAESKASQEVKHVAS